MSDEEAIRRVLVNYGMTIDERDWVRFRDCFTEDADADYGAVGHWTSADEITAYMTKSHLKYATTQHRMTNILADVSGDRATASTYVDAVLPYAGMDRFIHAVGRYRDELARGSDGVWRIARRHFAFAFLRTVPLEQMSSVPPVE